MIHAFEPEFTGIDIFFAVEKTGDPFYCNITAVNIAALCGINSGSCWFVGCDSFGRTVFERTDHKSGNDGENSYNEENNDYIPGQFGTICLRIIFRRVIFFGRGTNPRGCGISRGCLDCKFASGCGELLGLTEIDFRSAGD